jgi:hypothetical protein
VDQLALLRYPSLPLPTSRAASALSRRPARQVPPPMTLEHAAAELRQSGTELGLLVL